MKGKSVFNIHLVIWEHFTVLNVFTIIVLAMPEVLQSLDACPARVLLKAMLLLLGFIWRFRD